MNINEDDNNLFQKHYTVPKKLDLVFDDNTINLNKKLLKEFKNNGLIKEIHHFNTEDTEMNEKDDKYFGNVIENTVKNQNLYCSYIDYFDKMWMGNKVKGKI